MNQTSQTLLDTVEIETGPAPEWTVLWLHGLGADGNDFAPLVPNLVRKDWPALRFVFPHAPPRAVTINNGMRMRAWYDIRDMNLANRADEAGVEESIVQVEALIAREAERGMPASRVLLVGFSQGGAITLAAGMRRTTPLAGLVALSTYIPMAERLLATLPAVGAAATQPVFMAHGQFDPVVPYQAGDMGARQLRTLGFDVDWHAYPMAHQVCDQQVRDLGDWLTRRFTTG
ncbi:alpha/beta hydrolase [Montanilutibacter psychrotolerans]|uniref:Carboxylesterase n=1 Tax=Montanilutibacter psychrotolerans TaxID=1327343 RepID=A0A3M8SYE5_9GAMM|nr:alpha/beta hydrolase [Lysobacter psychrotolerans]RNF84466.1 carboxylesterase [Lysobacter psychrotolerans]